MTTNNA